jgi:putative redox protein
MAERPPVTLTLRWEEGLRFEGEARGHLIRLDGDGSAAVTPVETLGFALASCMASDVVHILRKQRSGLRGCELRFSGRRAETDPRRFLAVELHFVLAGELDAQRVERAIALSRDKYCSVWHSMQPEIELRTTFELSPPAAERSR